MAPITIQPLLLVSTILLTIGTKLGGAANLGVCYTRDGNNLPPADDAVRLYQIHQIGRMRIFKPDHEILQALKGSTIQLTIGVPNSEVGAMAKDEKVAIRWFQRHIQPYVGQVQFRYIVVGQNDMVSPRDAKVVLQAMRNLQYVIRSYSLQNQIKITTEVQWHVLTPNFPPSDVFFDNSSTAGLYMEPIVEFLSNHSSPLFVLFQPYFDPIIRQTLVEPNSDGSHGNEYFGTNWVPDWIDFVLDMFYSAMEKVGVTNVRVAVGQTGWPSAGGENATVEKAKNYVWSLAEHVLSKKGTPMRPGSQIETYVFELFNQNRRRPVAYRNFGMFYPNKEPVYGIPPLL